MKYKEYPKYKDSGVEWIRKIPEEWQVKKLKFILDMPVSDGPHETPVFQDSGIPFFSVDNIQNNKLFLEKLRFITKEDHKRFSLKCKPQKNDLLLGKAASVGKIALVDLDSEFNVWSPLAVIRVSQLEMLPKFCYFMFRSDFLQLQISLKVNWNTQGNIGMKDIENLKIIIPSKIEQEQIINFLDKNTTQFDKLITKSKKQITILEEKRQATINQAVTKGLDPSVKMKDSDIEWTDKIPKHWSSRKLKYCIQLFSKKSIDNTGERPYVGLENIESKTGKLIGELSVGFVGDSKLFEPRDVLFGKLRPYLAKAVLADFSGQSSGEILALRAEKIKPELLHQLVLSDGFIKTVNSLTYGAKMPRAEWGLIGNIRIPLTPEKEQDEIIDFIKTQTTQFDELASKIQKQITLLEEKKEALITAAVTGKIDVRDSVGA